MTGQKVYSLDNFSLVSYPWQQMSARQVLKIIFCHDAWHKINKNGPRISLLVERARASPASVRRQNPDSKRGSGCHSRYQYPLSLDYTADQTWFGTRKTLLCMTNKEQPVELPQQVTSALPTAPLVSERSLWCGCTVPTAAQAEGQS